MEMVRSNHSAELRDALCPTGCAEETDARSSPTRKKIEKTTTTSPPNSPTINKTPMNGRPPEIAESSTPSAPDETSEIDVDVQARQLRALERVEILRRRTLRTRTTLKDRRKRLRSLREEVRDALDKLMKKLNEVVASNSIEGLKELQPYHEAVQKSQDELGPAEDAYEQLETKLEDEEYDLEQEEDHFYRHFDVSRFAIADAKLDDAISPLIQPEHSSESDITSEELSNNPLQKYLNEREEAEYLKDELDALENDHAQLSQEASFRKRHKLALSAESATFLAEFEATYAQALEDLHGVEEDLISLRKECIEQGLFTEPEYPYEARHALKEELFDFIEDAQRDRSPLRAAAQNVEYEEKPRDYDDKRDYVNKWLLQWVQASSMEALMLRAWIYFKYPSKAKELAEDEWSELAVEKWDVDSMGKGTNESYKASRMDAIGGDDTVARMTGLSVSLGSLNVGFDELRDEKEVYLDIEEEKSTGTAKNDSVFMLVMRPRSNTT